MNRKFFSLLALTAVLAACGRSDTPRLFFLGIDGASWVVMGPMLDAGELPNFARLRREGAVMPDFETMEPTSSPVVWTTVATGRDPEDHGIGGFTDTLPSGDVIPVSGNSRKSKAIWEIATERGKSVGVIGWWASWPAEEVNGYVISDHANPALSELFLKDRRYWTADPEELAKLRRDFYPLDIAPTLAASWLDKDEFPFEDVQLRSKISDEQVKRLQWAPWNQRTYYSFWKTVYTIDFPLFRIAMDLLEERPVDLQMLYLRGPDPVQHYAWHLVEPEKFVRQSQNYERDRGLVEGVYRYLDGFLGELLDRLDPNTWLIVASDHGAEPREDSMEPGTGGRPGTHGRDARGVLFLWGPHVREGMTLDRGTPWDLMPTMAWLLDLPVSAELPGNSLTEAFETEFVDRKPVKMTRGYGPREALPSLTSDVDEKMLESLRALGYID